MCMKCADIPMGGWVGACQITKNGINLNLIEIIQVYLKIYDLWRLCHPHTYVSVYSSVSVYLICICSLFSECLFGVMLHLFTYTLHLFT